MPCQTSKRSQVLVKLHKTTFDVDFNFHKPNIENVLQE